MGGWKNRTALGRRFSESSGGCWPMSLPMSSWWQRRSVARIVGHAGLIGGSVGLLGCLPAPSFELPGPDGYDPFETDAQPFDPSVTAGATEGGGSQSGSAEDSGTEDGTDDDDGVEVDSGVDPDPTSGEASDGPTTGPTETETETESGGGEETGGVETGDPVDPGPSFPPSPPFGDDASETGLVGTWTASWSPQGVPDVSLQVSASGAFQWVETSADCSQSMLASGQLWVEDDMLTMHVETWDKRDPWPMENVVGEPLARPFRLRLGFATAADVLGISGPEALTELQPWQGRVYSREAAGIGPLGSWSSSAELWALREGYDEPQLVVQESYALEADFGAVATVSTTTTWLHEVVPAGEPPIVTTGGWFNQTPGQLVGMAWISGITYLYDELRLAAFAEDRTLRRNLTSDCG